MEEWRDIPGYEGLYQVSDYGQIRNTKTGYVLKFEHHYRGYVRVDLCKNKICVKQFVHRIVAITFLDNPENKEYVNHLDRNKKNNWIKNLEWATPAENNYHWMQDNRDRDVSGLVATGGPADIPF